MELSKLDQAINDLMFKAEIGECTKQELQFLKNLKEDLTELIEQLDQE